MSFLPANRRLSGRKLITRTSRGDKEFPFQNWFKARLAEADVVCDQGGRNSYPDFATVHRAEGYELKALAWPGRDASYDANSQVPSGIHNGRTIFYVFGRYPAKVFEVEFPVVDLVLCHGDFLNVRHDYVHKNKSVKGFGSYGDLLIRDRKMYVAPTPFALTEGTTGQRTLIIPEDMPIDDRLDVVGRLVRTETDQLVIGYEFNLVSNILAALYAPNPNAGKLHTFVACRARGEDGPIVSLVGDPTQVIDQVAERDE